MSGSPRGKAPRLIDDTRSVESDGHSKDQGPASDRLPDADAATTLRPALAGGAPARIGPFRILAPIGEGGMGIVYEAEQEHPQRRVALKVIRPGMVPADVLRRFEHEAEVLGRLQHPGIAQIYEAGIEETGTARSRTSRWSSSAAGRSTSTCGRSGRDCATGWCWWPRSRTPCSTPTSAASSTATSSRRTSWSPRRASRRCSTSASPAPPPTTAS